MGCEQQNVNVFRSVKWGGLKVFVGVSVIVLWVLLAVLFFLKHAVFGEMFKAAFLVVWTGGAVVYTLAAAFTGVEFFKNYWRRNVCGYDAYYWLEAGGGEKVLCVEHGKYPYPEDRPTDRVIAVIPLGGWFSRPRLSQFTASASREPLTGVCQAWTIRAPQPIHSFCISMVEVVDKDGRSVALSLYDALFVLQHLQAHGCVEWDRPWFSLVPMLVKQVVSLWESHKGSDKELGQWREQSYAREKTIRGLLEAIVEAVQGIANTTRLFVSKDARRIRQALVRQTLAVLPEDDLQHGGYGDALRYALKPPKADKPGKKSAPAKH